MFFMLVVCFVLIARCTGTLTEEATLELSEGLAIDVKTVSRLYTVIMSKLAFGGPDMQLLVDFLQKPWNATSKHLQDYLRFGTQTPLWRKYRQEIEAFIQSQCGKTLHQEARFLAEALNLSKTCSFQQLPNKTLRWDCNPNRNIKKLEKLAWIFSLLDSWGRPVPGLGSQGQFLWYGDYQQCLNTQVPDVSLQWAPAHYCMMKSGTMEMQMKKEPETYLEDTEFNRMPLIFKIGVCLPQSCGRAEMKQVILILSGIISANTTTTANETNSADRVSFHCSSDKDRERSVGTILTVVVIFFLLTLVLLGTAVDLLEENQWFRRKFKKCWRSSEVPSNRTRWIRKSRPEDPLSYKSLTSVRRTLKKPRWWLKILVAFSIRLNFAWIFQGEVLMGGRNGRFRYHRSTDPRGNHVTCLFGMKFWSMVWVIVGHTYLFSLPYMSNIAVFAERFQKEFFAQLVLNASLSVDTFFFISGFLVTYVWYRRTERNSGGNLRRPQHWILFYTHRWLRLTPAYALIMGITFYLYARFGEGPNWDERNLFGAQCSKHDWWKHLFFISNFFPSQCLPWMWFLAVEMQFFLFTPLILILFWKSTAWGVVFSLASILLSGVARGIYITEHKFPPNLLLLLPNQEFNNDLASFFYTVYTRPYMRAGPFFVGIMFGWRLAKCGHRMGRLRYRNHWKIRLYWLFALLLGFWCLFGAYPLFLGYSNPLYNFGLSAFTRTLWSVSVGITVELCHTSGENLFNKFFSWSGWRPFSRLTYSVYLCHELIQLAYFQSTYHPETYEGYMQMTIYSIGFVCLSYLFALPLNLLAESPPLALERLIFKRQPRPSKDAKSKHPQVGIVPPVCKRQRINGWVYNPHQKLADLPEPPDLVEGASEDEEETEATDPTQISDTTLSSVSSSPSLNDDKLGTLYPDDEDCSDSVKIQGPKSSFPCVRICSKNKDPSSKTCDIITQDEDSFSRDIAAPVHQESTEVPEDRCEKSMICHL